MEVPPKTPADSVRRFPWHTSPALVAELSARHPGHNFAEADVGAYILPDILTLANGMKVTTVAAWENERRGELLGLFRREVYGVAPTRPEQLSFRVVAAGPHASGDGATWSRVALTVGLGERSFVFHLEMFRPGGRSGKVPVFLLLDHRDPAAAETLEENRGGFQPVELALARGYALAVIATSVEVDPDQPDTTGGIRRFYREFHSCPDDFTWGTIGAWAWAASRAMDYFETDPGLDAARVALMGHSRGGKTALWAGAQDERFALICPNDSGHAGAALSKRNFGENVAAISRRFPHWFAANYHRYGGREEQLPVDQHQLVALLAPRGYHDGEASADLWADPGGAWLSFAAASAAWTLYGHTPINPDPLPLVNEVVRHGPLGWHMHDGGHQLGYADWRICFDQADALFGRC